MALIEFDRVSKAYGTRLVVRDLSLAIEQYERLALLGRSGAGKTTVLRLVAGLTAPDAGAVRIGGAVVSAGGSIRVPAERRSVGMVFQDLALWPHLTVEGNLRFGLEARGVSRSEAAQRIDATLGRLDLARLRTSRPGTLSGGEQQRVAIARALVLRPEILLMDEPLANLNPELEARVAALILELAHDVGFTLIYVTHRREEALRLGTRIAIMDEGRFVQCGTAAELTSDVSEAHLP